MELEKAALDDHLKPYLEAGIDPGPLCSEVIEEDGKVIVRFWYEFEPKRVV